MVKNLSPFPQLMTDRLQLRQLNAWDEEEIYLLRSDDIVNKYLVRPKAKSLEDAQEFIKRIQLNDNNYSSVFWAICFRDSSRLIGTICLWNFSETENKAEIGYELLPAYHGKGIMQEAFSRVIEFGFSTLGLNSIEAWTVQQNESSRKVLERGLFQRDASLEKKIDKALDGPETIIYSLSRVHYLNSRL